MSRGDLRAPSNDDLILNKINIDIRVETYQRREKRDEGNAQHDVLDRHFSKQKGNDCFVARLIATTARAVFSVLVRLRLFFFTKNIRLKNSWNSARFNR